MALPRVPWLLWLVLAAIVVVRSGVFIWSDFAHFDSDQAVFGLMASDIAAGRALPLHVYGQQYLFPLGSWLAAPLFALTGPSVLALKLPMLGLNLGVVWLLLRALIRDAGLSKAGACVVALFFALPPVVTASRLVELAANVEQFWWTLVLWTVRRRPWAVGLVAALGFVNREFVAYAFAALLMVDVIFTRDGWRLLARRWMVQGGTFVGAVTTFAALARVAPHVPGPSPHIVWTPTLEALALRLESLATELLPTLFGLQPVPLRLLAIASELPAALPLAGWPVGIALAALVVAGVIRIVRTASTRDPRQALPWFLVITGTGSAMAFVLFGPPSPDLMLIRYVMLALLIPIGFACVLLQAGSLPWERRVIGTVVVLWVAAHAVPHMRLIHEYRVSPPSDDIAILAGHLRDRALTRGEAGYWLSYNLTFRSGGHVVVRNTSWERITSGPYWFDGAPEFTVADNPTCEAAVLVAKWWVCPTRQLTGVVDDRGTVSFGDQQGEQVAYDARAIRQLVSGEIWRDMTFVRSGGASWLRAVMDARLRWARQGARTFAAELESLRAAPVLVFRIPGSVARVRLIDLDTGAVLATSEWRGETNSLWSQPVASSQARTGVLIEVIEPPIARPPVP